MANAESRSRRRARVSCHTFFFMALDVVAYFTLLDRPCTYTRAAVVDKGGFKLTSPHLLSCDKRHMTPYAVTSPGRFPGNPHPRARGVSPTARPETRLTQVAPRLLTFSTEMHTTRCLLRHRMNTGTTFRINVFSFSTAVLGGHSRLRVAVQSPDRQEGPRAERVLRALQLPRRP